MAIKRAELEEARLVRTFKGVDDDGSGEIELDEWRTLMRKMAPHLSEGAVEWTFQCIDVDGSGAIDFDEFKVMMSIAENEDEAGKALKKKARTTVRALIMQSRMKDAFASFDAR